MPLRHPIYARGSRGTVAANTSPDGQHQVCVNILAPNTTAVVALLREAIDYIDAPSDYADGGVTAAAVEDEAEPTDVWRRRAEKAEAAYEDLREQYGTAVREKDEWEANTDEASDALRFAEAAADDWHTAAVKCSEEALNASKRARKAEDERDEAVAARDRAQAAWMNERLHPRAAEPRPLTPEDITDEMVQRAAEAIFGPKLTDGHRDVARRALTAALTEPPQRPDWADLEDVLDADWPGGINGANNGIIARALHESGVRVTGGEDR